MTALACPRLAVALLPLGLFLPFACNRDNTPDTGIIVEVSSDLRVPQDIKQVKLTATDPQGNSLYDYTYDLGNGANQVMFPFRVGLYPLRDTTTPIHVEAVGQLNGPFVASRSATLSFVQGKKVVVELPLLAVCKNVTCKDASLTCKANGQCDSDTVDTKNLPPYVPNQPVPGGTGGTTAMGGATASGGKTSAGGTGTGGAQTTGGTKTTGGTTASGGSGGASGSGSITVYVGPPPPSCSGLAATCGPLENDDCCTSLLVPGGKFNRSNDPNYPAKVADFYLDKYEITVGRFRQFVNAGMGTSASPPAPGAGVHPLIAGSGWNSAWNGYLPGDTATLKELITNVGSPYSNWTDKAGANENRPLNGMLWYVAFAFCAWDGGRLPTEAEWNYAAAGGSEQREYPWGSGIDYTKASYDSMGDGNPAWAVTDFIVVGSKPAGNGKWGHADLAGNLWEWTLDWSASVDVSPYRNPCDSCAVLTPTDASTFWMARGGGAGDQASELQSAYRAVGFWEWGGVIGARCARSVPSGAGTDGGAPTADAGTGVGDAPGADAPPDVPIGGSGGTGGTTATGGITASGGKTSLGGTTTAGVTTASGGTTSAGGTTTGGHYQMENLDRGVVAVKVSGGVYVGWRMFGYDYTGTDSDTSYNLYKDGTKVANVTDSANYLDAAGTTSSIYTVTAVIKGIEGPQSAAVTPWAQQYTSIPLSPPSGSYSANDGSPGDLDGDGKLDIVLKWDPSNSRDNSQTGVTDNVMIDGYSLNGLRFWRIDLGPNIRAGAHYTQFVVYDFDGDGKAEVVVKTAPGTKDGAGNYLQTGPAATDDDTVNYRNADGYILTGPEYLTVFDGATGKELATIDYPVPRGNVSAWGDTSGNWVDRFNGGIAFVKEGGVAKGLPSIISGRGYYTRMTVSALTFRNGVLAKNWVYDSVTALDANGSGNPWEAAADVDGDGAQEIITGASTINSDGSLKCDTRLGMGDAMDVGELIPGKGIAVFSLHDALGGQDAHDGATCKPYFNITNPGQAASGGRAEYVGTGNETSASCSGPDQVLCATGASGGPSAGSNFLIYWDADEWRELEDATSITKAGGGTLLNCTRCAPNSGAKATPTLTADLFGDWREEIVWRDSGNTMLNIYTTTNVTKRRIYTLMHDPTYRSQVSFEQSAHNQPPHTGFRISPNMDPPPKPDIFVR